MRILIINGPNMNLLGLREPQIYGRRTYSDLISLIEKYANDKNVEVAFYQSNHEGDIVDKIQWAYSNKIDGIILNPAAYTHTSIAIPDALKAVGIPTVEVHISNVQSREEFRKISYISSVCIKTIVGRGFNGYLEAIDALMVNSKC